METILFTDGSSRGNPGAGGWAVVLINLNSKTIKEIGGRESLTTNNRMELRAVMEGLKNISHDNAIKIFSDSSYVIKGITQWIKNWKKNGWLTQNKEDVVNKDLWMEIDQLISGKNISWQYVGGHIGIVGNERCDEIATSFADDENIKLYEGPISEYSLPTITNISFDEAKLNNKKSKSSRSSAKAYSYVSLVDNKIEVHKTWLECEKRVKGVKARYKKALDAAEEQEIIKEFSL